MYAALWRLIPGGWPVRLVVFGALLGGVVWLLITIVYPWVMHTFLPTPTPVIE